MARQISVDEAKEQLSRIVHEVETGGPVELTTGGRTVAVLMSIAEYHSLSKKAIRDWWDVYIELSKIYDYRKDGIDDSFFEGLRDDSPGRTEVIFE